jgi:hypothetical protein
MHWIITELYHCPCLLCPGFIIFGTLKAKRHGLHKRLMRVNLETTLTQDALSAILVVEE